MFGDAWSRMRWNARVSRRWRIFSVNLLVLVIECPRFRAVAGSPGAAGPIHSVLRPLEQTMIGRYAQVCLTTRRSAASAARGGDRSRDQIHPCGHSRGALLWRLLDM